MMRGAPQQDTLKQVVWGWANNSLRALTGYIVPGCVEDGTWMLWKILPPPSSPSSPTLGNMCCPCSSCSPMLELLFAYAEVFRLCWSFFPTHLTLFHFTLLSPMRFTYKMGSCPARHMKRNFDTDIFALGKYSRSSESSKYRRTCHNMFEYVEHRYISNKINSFQHTSILCGHVQKVLLESFRLFRTNFDNETEIV